MSAQRKLEEAPAIGAFEKVVSAITSKSIFLTHVPTGLTIPQFVAQDKRIQGEHGSYSLAEHLLAHPYLLRSMLKRRADTGAQYAPYRIDFLGTTAKKRNVVGLFHPSLQKEELTGQWTLHWIRDFHGAQYVCSYKWPPP